MSKISLIITNYNHGYCLIDAVETESTNQDKSDEVLIIDDGSTDNSKSVIQSLKENTPSYCHLS